MAYLYLFIGIAFLLIGGDLIVRASVDIALRLKVSILVIGMTVVSFATSAPELLVSIDAAMRGYTDLSFGNVIGSNIANIALILGLTAFVFPLDVKVNTYKIDWWVMMGVTVLLYFFLVFDDLLGFWEAFVLVFLLVFYNYYQITKSRKVKSLEEKVEKIKLTNPWLTALFLVIGVAGLKYGSDFLVEGAVELAGAWGVSERIIGITVVSVGTSLPELSASLVAAIRKKPDLSVGNLIGSNIFNILAVLGISGLIIDLPLKSATLLHFDFPALLIICSVLYVMMRIIGKGFISRWEGLILFLIYVLYIILVF